MIKGSRKIRMPIRKALFFFLLLAPSAWGRVFVHWTTPELPSANSLGLNDIVFGWKDGISPMLVSARKQGYRVYVETPMQQARAAAEVASKADCTGIMLDAGESDGTKTENDVASLRSAYPRLEFLMLNSNGKQPEMRGSLIIKRGSVLEVSSPTAQPWIDTNLALIRVEQRSRKAQIPLYTFSWTDQGRQRTLTADDYSLAVAEAGAFHSDLVLQLDEHLQQGLHNHDVEAWTLWNQIRCVLKFANYGTEAKVVTAANVALVVEQLDPSDEVLNLLSRHNIPFQVVLPADLKTEELNGFDIVIVFAKLDRENAERISGFASRGATVVLVGAQGNFPWHSSQPVQLNEHTNSYALGKGKILEFSEPVADPEIFAQDIRRLLGHNALMSLWNGLTTIAVPYRDRGGTLTTLELVNYAAEPLRVQVQVKGSFASVRYESPEQGCCESLEVVKHGGFTEFVVPDLRITGRVHLDQ